MFVKTVEGQIDTIDSIELFKNTWLVVVGCYELVDKSRCGDLYLFIVVHESALGVSLQNIDEKYHFEYGILDVKIKLVSNNDSSANVLIVAIGSDAMLHIFEVTIKKEITESIELDTNYEIHLAEIFNENIDQSSNFRPIDENKENNKSIGLGLDVNWNNTDYPVVWSCSDGNVYSGNINQLCICNKIQFSHTTNFFWKAHIAEIWSAALDPTSNGNIIATGADDCILKLWDIRNLKIPKPEPIHLNYKEHTQGITAITYCPFDYNYFVTGSYDSCIRFWDKRNIVVPVDSYNAVDGIWRLKFEPFGLIVGATHGGCEIFSYDVTQKKWFTLYVHNSHESMVYGVSSLNRFQKSSMVEHVTETKLNKNKFYWEKSEISHLYVSGSFYDRKLAFWDI